MEKLTKIMCNKVAKFNILPDFSNLEQLEHDAVSYSGDCPIHDITYTALNGSPVTIRNTSGSLVTTTLLNMAKCGTIAGTIKKPSYAYN